MKYINTFIHLVISLSENNLSEEVFKTQSKRKTNFFSSQLTVHVTANA